MEEGQAVWVLPDAAALPLAEPRRAQPSRCGHVDRVRSQDLADEFSQVLTLSLRTWTETGSRDNDRQTGSKPQSMKSVDEKKNRGINNESLEICEV